MRTHKTVLLNKDNPTFNMVVSTNQYVNIIDIVNKHKYLVEALVTGNPQNPPRQFSLIDKCVYGINTEAHNTIYLTAQQFKRDEDFVSLEIVSYPRQ